MREQWATEGEQPASAREVWESKMKSFETNFGTAAAKFDARLASWAVLQCRHQQQQGQELGMGIMGGVGRVDSLCVLVRAVWALTRVGRDRGEINQGGGLLLEVVT